MKLKHGEIKIEGSCGAYTDAKSQSQNSNLPSLPQATGDGNSFVIIIRQSELASLNAPLSRDWSLGDPSFYQGYTVEVTHLVFKEN